MCNTSGPHEYIFFFRNALHRSCAREWIDWEYGEDERRRAEENWIDWECGEDERRRAEEKEAKLSCLFRGNAAMALSQSYRQRATRAHGERMKRDPEALDLISNRQIPSGDDEFGKRTNE
jgi:hypothetical protein